MKIRIAFCMCLLKHNYKCIARSNYYLQIMDQQAKLLMKGSNDSLTSSDHEFSILNKRILWCDKFWIRFHDRTKNVHIQDVATTQMHQILPFPYSDIYSIQWNQKQSSFIVFDKDGHPTCIVERVYCNASK